MADDTVYSVRAWLDGIPTEDEDRQMEEAAEKARMATWRRLMRERRARRERGEGDELGRVEP